MEAVEKVNFGFVQEMFSIEGYAGITAFRVFGNLNQFMLNNKVFHLSRVLNGDN